MNAHVDTQMVKVKDSLTWQSSRELCQLKINCFAQRIVDNYIELGILAAMSIQHRQSNDLKH